MIAATSVAGRGDHEATAAGEAGADPGTQRRVLVVDDEHRNREIVRTVLSADGYVVAEAEDGAAALARVAAEPFDVILMDVRMPGMDGVEACHRLKADPATVMIPVLIVTAHDSRDERLRGIEAGASDFLTKPLDMTDLRLRVHNAAASKRLYDELQAEYARVVELERMRDSLVHMIAHDIKSPLTAVSGNLEMLKLFDQETLSPESMECVTEAIEATAVVVGMVHTMLDLSRLEANEMPIELETVALVDIADAGLAQFGTRAGRVVIEEASVPDAQVLGDSQLLTRVLVNMVDNALDFSPTDGAITVAFSANDPYVRVSVSDEGPGVEPHLVEHVFEKFGQGELGTAKPRKGSAGLGLAFCKLAVESQGGRVGVESTPGHGATFWFEVPRPRPDTTGPRATA